MQLTLSHEDLHTCLPHAKDKHIILYTKAINQAMLAYEITTPLRVAAFIAQIGFETGSLNYMQEIWGPTQAQLRYDRDTALAKALGNTSKEALEIAATFGTTPGYLYRGRGAIQLTGYYNYKLFGELLDKNYVRNPAIVANAENAFIVAGEFWKKKNLNLVADRGNIKIITKKINGGYNGLSKRTEMYEHILQLFHKQNLL